MAVLEKIRVKFGLAVSIIIALALLSFIIDPSTLQTVAQSMSSKYDVGSIAGKNISYTDFQADVERYTTINQIVTGSSVQDEQTQKQIRESAWQELIDRYMFVKNARKAGINVGNDELVSLTTSANASPVVSQNPVFLDAKGQFNPKNVIDFVQNIANDESGQMKTYWNFVQNTVNTQQYYVKYGSLFTAGNFVNNLVKDKDVLLNNTKAVADIVMVPYGFDRDSTIVIKDSEIRAYYNAHKKDYKQQSSRDIEYVVFEVVPSAEDINATADDMNKAYAEFAGAENIKNFLLKNSERSLSDYWYKKGDLRTIHTAIDEFVFGNGKGVSEIITEGNSFYAARVVETAMIPDSAYVKHILIQGENAKKTADSLLVVVKAGADFSALAAAHSVDQSSAADGQIGNIGWMTQNYMIPGFESVMTAETGKPFILDTRYGSHVVIVTRKTAPVMKKRVAILEKTTLASKETINNWYAKANRFATLAGGNLEGYRKAVDSLGVYSHNMNITEATASYGAVDNAKELTRWAFDNKVGKASEIITVNQKYFFIAAIKADHKEGFKPVGEVASVIRENLYNEARNAKIAKEIAGKIAGLTSIDEIAQKLEVSVDRDREISFSPLSQQMIEPAVAGAVSRTAAGEIGGPVEGIAGVYVYKVNSRDEASFYTVEDAEQFEARKAQYAGQMIIPVMMEAANVKDNRARFY